MTEGNTNPTRVKRRQSDAKWRANLASCYETLKLIIPVNRRASKRQISKAKILEETTKHINFLENILTSLLQSKAKKDGCLQHEVDKYVKDRIAKIKQEFANQVKEKQEQGGFEKTVKPRRYKQCEPGETIYERVERTAPVRQALHSQAFLTNEQEVPMLVKFPENPPYSFALNGTELNTRRNDTVEDESQRQALGGGIPIHRRKALHPRKRLPVKCVVKSIGGIPVTNRPSKRIVSEQRVPFSPKPALSRKDVLYSAGQRDAVVPAHGTNDTKERAPHKQMVRPKTIYLPTNRQLFEATPEKRGEVGVHDLYCNEEMWQSEDEASDNEAKKQTREEKANCQLLKKRSYLRGVSKPASHCPDYSGLSIFRKHVTSMLTCKVKATGFGADLSKDDEISRNIAQLWLQLPEKKRQQFSQLADELRQMKDACGGSELKDYLDALTSDLEISVEAFGKTVKPEQKTRDVTAGKSTHDGNAGNNTPMRTQHIANGKTRAEPLDDLDMSLICEENTADIDLSTSSTTSATSDDSQFSVVPDVRTK